MARGGLRRLVRSQGRGLARAILSRFTTQRPALSDVQQVTVAIPSNYRSIVVFDVEPGGHDIYNLLSKRKACKLRQSHPWAEPL